MKSDCKICAIVPTYNNAATLSAVLSGVQEHVADIIVVADGCTDATLQLPCLQGEGVEVISYEKNKGKGYALKQGFRRAKERGFDYALTIDADGQHYPADIPALLAALATHTGALVVGSRDLAADNMPEGNTFANRFSNFWFKVETGQSLPDTQTGLRVYPLQRLSGWRLMSSRYEAEFALLVFAAWAGVELVPVNVRVYYPPAEERVSHFRPYADFARISAMNTLLCFGAVVYGYPRRFFRLFRKKKV